MATGTGKTSIEQDPTVRNYFLFSVGAMVVVLLLLLRRGLGPWALAPALTGIIGAVFQIRLAPLLTLIVLAATLVLLEPLQIHGSLGSNPFTSPEFNGSLPDWLLSAAILAYFASHYRLLCLTVAYFPDDSGKRGRSLGARVPVSERANLRSTKSIAPGELSWFILSLPVWAALAQILWKLAPSGANPYQLESSTWQGIVFGWRLGLVLLLVTGLVGYVIWQQRTRSQAMLLLQDVIWRETCRDQRRIYRELARERRRRAGKEES